MKRLLVFLALAAFVPAGACANEGLLALYADLGATDCDAEIGFCSPVPTYLFYVRGDGPRTVGCFAFSIKKSNPDVMFLEPEWVGPGIFFGDLEGGMEACLNGHDIEWCEEDDAALLVVTIRVLNLTDPDTLSLTVAPDPNYPASPLILLCESGYPKYNVLGGTFIFNGTCSSPEDPYGEKTAVVPRSWGAIKSMYRSN